MKIEGKSHFGVRGFFTLSACQKDDNGNVVPGTVRDLGSFENLITDNGLELMKGSGFLGYIQVGAGSAAPANSDTTLGAWVAGMAASVSQGPSDLTPTDYPWVSANATCQFGKGVAAGNLSEIGVGKTSSGNLFSRALIKDAGGAPTTITVTSIEYLTVNYNWRVYYDLTYSHTGSFTVNGATVATTTVVGGIYQSGAVDWNSYGPHGYTTAKITAYSGAFNAAGGHPSTSIAPTNGIGGTISNGPAGSYYSDNSAHAATTDWIGTISCFEASYGQSSSLCSAPMKVSLSPAVVKDNTMELDITMRIAWGRKV